MSETSEPAIEAAYLPCPGPCMRGSDIGVYSPGDPVAYAHPNCPVHGGLCDCGHAPAIHFQDGCTHANDAGYCACLDFEAAK